MSKNLPKFLEISHVQKEVFLSHKLQDHAYELQNQLELKEDNRSVFLPADEKPLGTNFPVWFTYYQVAQGNQKTPIPVS